MHDRLRAISTTLRIPACRKVFSSQLISGLGDWAGRLALAVVVFERSDSAAWAAAVTAVSLLPWLGPGQFLATLADRYGRVRVMVTADLSRAVLFGAMALVTSVPLLLVLAFLAGLCVPPFEGAKSSAIVELTDDETYPSAIAVHAMVNQVEILLGYALGGIVIALVGSRPALAINAATFVLSALIIIRLAGSAASKINSEADHGWAGVAAGTRPWREDAICQRALLLYIGTSMFSVLPEALVVPFADEVDIPAGAVGVIAALIGLGSFVGALFAPSSGSPEQLLRSTAVRGLAVAVISGLLFASSSALLAVGVAFVVTGMVDAIAVPTNQVVGQRLPATGRAAALTVAMGAQNVAHVISITAAGAVADATDTRRTLAIAMGAAAIVCIWAALRPIRGAEPPTRVEAPDPTASTSDRTPAPTPLDALPTGEPVPGPSAWPPPRPASAWPPPA